MKHTSLVFFTYFLSALLFSLRVYAVEPLDYRLPHGINPTSQTIELHLDPSKTDFTGHTSIQLRIDKTVERIGIYQSGLDLQSVLLDNVDATRELQTTNGEWEISWLADGDNISPGTYELRIDFAGSFATDSLGAHRVTFEDNDYVFTQMEAMYARRAVPLFDEPAFKIPYKLTIHAPAGLTVLANTPIERRKIENDWQRVEFMETKPLPSYLLAFAVGPLDRAPINGMSVPGFVYTPKGRADEVGFVVRETPVILNALENYFGAKYHYRKMDFLAVPEFAFGAMENPGLITYRTDLLLLGDNPSGSTAEFSLMVIAHELAHIWFGDLVTMQWWDDLWLNEAFASWMAYTILNRNYPEYETSLFLPQEDSFTADARTTSKAIRKVVRNEDEVSDGLGLNYSKGHALLNMIETFVGATTFQQAMQEYTQEFAWGNANESDLWRIVSNVSGLDVGQIASDYLNQPGYALVDITAEGQLTQERYLEFGRSASDLQWNMPLAIKYKHDGKVQESFYLLNAKQGTLDIPSNTDWIFPDAGATGYFRWKTEFQQYQTLVDDSDSLTDREKIALMSNSSALLARGDQSLGDYLFVVDRFLHDPHPLVFLPALENIKRIGDNYVDSTTSKMFARYVDQTLSERLKELGTNSLPTDSESITKTRPRLIRMIGQYGNNRTVLSDTRKLAMDYLKDPDSVQSDLGREALRVTSLRDDGDLYDDYIKAYLTAKSQDFRSNILVSIYFDDPAIIRSHLDFSLSDDVQAGDAIRGLFLYSTTLDDPTLLYEWLEENIDRLKSKVPEFLHARLPLMMQLGCNKKNLKMVQDFFGDRGDMYQRSLEKAVETIENCIGRKTREHDALVAFLDQHTD